MDRENDVKFWAMIGACVGITFDEQIAAQIGCGIARKAVLSIMWQQARGEA